MAGLFLERVTATEPASLAAARSQFRAHGFADPTAFAVPGWQALHWPPMTGSVPTMLVRGDDRVVVAGTLVYDGLIGAAALARLLDTAALPSIDWSRIGGEFVAMVRQGGRNFLFCDYFASYQLFHDVEGSFFSTSFLAATACMPRLRFDRQGLYEYAFNAAAIGDDTVIDGLKTLGPDRMIELTPDGIRTHALRKDLPIATTDETLADRLVTHRDRLMATIEPFVQHYGDAMHCPLSGGLDSRLVLAALRAAGAAPSVYVYGPPGDTDVAIARQIGARQGFDVRWIDKAATVQLAPEAFAAQVEINFEQSDALPNFGNIFDNGGNLLAQQARHADGALAISGGCGEIFRNFFYLPDRPLSARDVARAFFARVSLADVTEVFDYRAFMARIADKIAVALDAEDIARPLARARIEQAYPRVRCRALFGREISLEGRVGAYAMPFIDHRMVAAALTLPMPLKRAGRFEAMLLNAIDPALAAEPSAYGHDFTGSPGRRHRLEEWSTRARPIWLREKSYAIQRRLKPMSDEHGGLLSSDYMGRVIDLDFPAMRRFFRIDRIGDSGLWRRIAALEYFAARMGARLEP
ncbi:hypothetical protein [Sphingomonas sp. PB4P5]|uniref:hypothetical protein n=1 Tax=Parasphingomonas puruogangriensis TaxID=3096155 RepID=UPI002FCB1560